MSGEGAYLHPSLNVPQTDDCILTYTCECVSIWTERYAMEIIRTYCGDGAYLGASLNVP